jgi:hypothetical protein
LADHKNSPSDPGERGPAPTSPRHRCDKHRALREEPRPPAYLRAGHGSGTIPPPRPGSRPGTAPDGSGPGTIPDQGRPGAQGRSRNHGQPRGRPAG